MNTLFEYLKKNYRYDEPIFLCDLQVEGLSDTNLRQQIKILTDAGYLLNYTTGIYCFKYEGEPNIDAKRIIESKYIYRNNKRFGYYSGLTFLNQIGISNQVPATKEIVSNNSQAIVKHITISNNRLIIRRPRVRIEDSNAYILPYLESLVVLDDYDDNDTLTSNLLLKKYATKYNITKEHVDKFIKYFPIKIYKTIYERGENNVFA